MSMLFFYSVASSVNRRPHDGKEDSAGAMRPCSRPLQTHVACAVLLASSTPLVGSVRLARVSRLAGSWLQPAIASHHRLALGPVPRALDGCAAATCTAPRAVPVRPSRASYSSLAQAQVASGQQADEASVPGLYELNGCGHTGGAMPTRSLVLPA